MEICVWQLLHSGVEQRLIIGQHGHERRAQQIAGTAVGSAGNSPILADFSRIAQQIGANSVGGVAAEKLVRQRSCFG